MIDEPPSDKYSQYGPVKIEETTASLSKTYKGPNNTTASIQQLNVKSFSDINPHSFENGVSDVFVHSEDWLRHLYRYLVYISDDSVGDEFLNEIRTLELNCWQITASHPNILSDCMDYSASMKRFAAEMKSIQSEYDIYRAQFYLPYLHAKISKVYGGHEGITEHSVIYLQSALLCLEQYEPESEDELEKWGGGVATCCSFLNEAIWGVAVGLLPSLTRIALRIKAGNYDKAKESALVISGIFSGVAKVLSIQSEKLLEADEFGLASEFKERAKRFKSWSHEITMATYGPD